MTYAWIPKKSRNTSEQPACHDLLIVLRYAMKSRVIYLYWLSRRNSIYLFIAIFILCYSCSPSTYGRALNCQNLYVEMGGKVHHMHAGCVHINHNTRIRVRTGATARRTYVFTWHVHVRYYNSVTLTYVPVHRVSQSEK